MHSPLGVFRLADDVLRGRADRRRGRPGGWRSATPVFTLMILGFGMFYGGVMGTYGGMAGARAWQLVYSAVKVPFLIVTTFALSVPSFFVVNTLLGLRGDFPRVIRALMATQAGLTVILTSLAPITAFWYVSGSAYQPAILFNGVMFAAASLVPSGSSGASICR